MAFALPGGKNSDTRSSLEARRSGRELLSETRQPRRELFGQILESLQTGGVGARVPIIQRSVEASNRATSDSQRQTTEQLGIAGLLDSPFGQRILGDQKREGDAATSKIPTDVAQSFVNLAPSFITGIGQTGTSSIGIAASSQAAIRSAQIAAVAQIISQSISTAGQISSSAIGAST